MDAPTHQWRKSARSSAQILLCVTSDFSGGIERGQDIHKTEKVRLERLIAHRPIHQPTGEPTTVAFFYTVEYLQPARFDFLLPRRAGVSWTLPAHHKIPTENLTQKDTPFTLSVQQKTGFARMAKPVWEVK
jgi:hypothetical protein